MDLKAEHGRIIRRGILALLVCAVVLAASWLILPRLFAFPTGLPERIAFALQVNVFVLFWVVVGVRLVAKGRFNSVVDNPGSAFAPPSPAIAVKVAFLQNSLEQAVVAAGAYLAFATLVSGPALALIPGAAMLFAIGRTTFLLGYPGGAGSRAFGIACTFIPTLCIFMAVILLIVAKLV